MSAHLSKWTLRRLHAGELPDSEEPRARAHVSACAECHEVVKGLEGEQARFEAEIPFDRFMAGVERTSRSRPAAPSRPQFLNGPLVAVAATVLLAVAVRPLLSESPGNRLKGGAMAELRIGGDGLEQRSVQPGTTEALAPGERVRLGYVADERHGYVLALSVDEAGEVSALYPSAGMSLPVEPGAGTHWLPDSVELTGSGHERLVLVLSDEPLDVEDMRSAALRAWERAGRNVAAMRTLGVGGEETHWLLRKP
jgi:hypothetical protein